MKKRLPRFLNVGELNFMSFEQLLKYCIKWDMELTCHDGKITHYHRKYMFK